MEASSYGDVSIRFLNDTSIDVLVHVVACLLRGLRLFVFVVIELKLQLLVGLLIIALLPENLVLPSDYLAVLQVLINKFLLDLPLVHGPAELKCVVHIIFVNDARLTHKQGIAAG